MRIVFSEHAWEDYLHWQRVDRSMLKRINELIRDIQRNRHDGLGKPEPLKHALAGYWSRRIDLEHRLVYFKESDAIVIVTCRFHY